MKIVLFLDRAGFTKFLILEPAEAPARDANGFVCSVMKKAKNPWLSHLSVESTAADRRKIS